MALVETKTYTRPNTSIPFWLDVDSQDRTTILNELAPYHASGNLTIETTNSEDGLTQTSIRNIDSLETYSNFLNLLTVEYTNKCINYQNINGMSMAASGVSLTGISNAFTVTTTINFPNDNSSTQANLVSSLSGLPSEQLANLIVTNNSVVATFQFTNSDDYNVNTNKCTVVVIAKTQIDELYSAGATRTFQFEYKN
jgi:hypothetical protein